MNRQTLAAVLFAILVGLGGWFWYQSSRMAQPPVQDTFVEEPAVADASPPPLAGEEQDAVRYPVEAPAAAAAGEGLPPLGESDRPITRELVQVAGEGPVLAWLVPDSLVRHFVATVDNLPHAHVAERTRVLRGARGPLAVDRSVVDPATGEEHIVLAAERNAARYDGAIAALQALDMQQVAALYRRWYPLLQRAYEDLGYPGRYFNDRVVEVIDHLLAAPSPQGPLELVQPKVLYEFADASLEARSAGQKLLIRMGPAHAQVVKEQLQRLRAAITGPAAPASPAAADPSLANPAGNTE